jgi:hypothetical protein
MQDFRNALVHSWQINTRQSQVSIKYVEGGQYYREQMPRETYHKDIERFYKQGIDKSVLEIAGHIWELKEPYMYLLHMLASVPDFIERIHSDIYGTLIDKRGEIIRGPIIYGGGMKVAVWESVSLKDAEALVAKG